MTKSPARVLIIVILTLSLQNSKESLVNPHQIISSFKNQIKANATSVSSNIRDGIHGNLGLILSDNSYDLIYYQPFIRPKHTSPLAIPPGKNAAVTIILRENHQEQSCLLYEDTSVEQFSKQQIN